METEIQKNYLPRMTPRQREIILNPALYAGVAANKALEVAAKWADEFFGSSGRN